MGPGATAADKLHLQSLNSWSAQPLRQRTCSKMSKLKKYENASAKRYEDDIITYYELECIENYDWDALPSRAGKMSQVHAVHNNIVEDSSSIFLAIPKEGESPNWPSSRLYTHVSL